MVYPSYFTEQGRLSTERTSKRLNRITKKAILPLQCRNRRRKLIVECLEDRRVLASDFGDAPLSYPVSSDQQGAEHGTPTLQLAPILGFKRDVEDNGIPSSDASSDGADDDGVSADAFVIGKTTSLSVQVSDKAGILDAWVDWNSDGDWDDTAEKIVAAMPLEIGLHSIPIDVPLDALVGTTFARFRLSSGGSDLPTGFATDGEVEDYQLIVSPSPYDFGDAPVSYPVTLEADGARHDRPQEIDLQYREFERPNRADEFYYAFEGYYVEQGEYGSSVAFSSDGDTLAIVTGSPGNGSGGAPYPSVEVYHRFPDGYFQEVDYREDSFAFGEVSLNDDGTVFAYSVPNAEPNGAQSGYVRVIQFNGDIGAGGIPIQLGTDLVGDNAGDLFGFRLALSGDGLTMAVASPGADTQAVDGGKVRVYRYDGTNWIPLGSDLVGESAGTRLGSSLVLSNDGTTLVVGGTGYALDGGVPTGITRVFSFVDDEWIQVGNDLVGTDENEDFGAAVALSQDHNLLVVGSPGKDGNVIDQGGVSFYRRTADTWVAEGDLLLGEDANSAFGHSLALSDSGGVLLVGAPFAKESIGKALVYKHQGSAWQLIDRFEGNNDFDLKDDRFGTSVALSRDGNELLIGAPGAADADGNPYGFARLFERDHDPVLGQAKDLEFDGFLSSQADGDGQDEDGVLFSEIMQGDAAVASITISGGKGVVDAWIDWNADGDWYDPNEKIFDSVELESGVSDLLFEVPADATLGLTFARFRVSKQGGLSVTGLTNNGEVEDYAIYIDSQLLPKIDEIENKTLSEDFGQQQITLTGIYAGILPDSSGDPNQLRIHATSSDTAILPDPTVTYTSPETIGQLNLTSKPNQSGLVQVQVVAENGGDDGDLSTPADNYFTTQQFTIDILPDNDSPTLDAIPDLSVDRNGSQQIVNLSGITAGGEESQPLRISTTSDNETVISTPAVSYASGNTTGTLTFTPVSDSIGLAIITVTVEDGGLDNELFTVEDNGFFSQDFLVIVGDKSSFEVSDNVLRLSIREPGQQVTVVSTSSGLAFDLQVSNWLGDDSVAITGSGSNRVEIADPAGFSQIELFGLAQEQSLNFTDSAEWRMGIWLPASNGGMRVAEKPGEQALEIHLDWPQPWKNVVNAFDINNDQLVSGLDALTVINEVSVGRYTDQATGMLLAPSQVDPWPGIYYDNNGDGRATALDALGVINYLARTNNVAQGEGELFRSSSSTGLASSEPKNLPDTMSKDLSDRLAPDNNLKTTCQFLTAATWVRSNGNQVDSSSADVGFEELGKDQRKTIDDVLTLAFPAQLGRFPGLDS